uniref:Uncharacterized protein n=1 Tax=Picea sitchensis TaxID=3332 RepID=A0A6B9XS93_PICSI|nr:hypothetical protein Q903MT_gene6906 [Picea sitchensis]
MKLKLESALQRRMHLCESDTSIGCVTQIHLPTRNLHMAEERHGHWQGEGESIPMA